MENRLTRFQRDLLQAFFDRESRFVLTGGGALAGFYLGHRTTEDLDFFTREDVLDDAERKLVAICMELGAELEKIRTAPDFRRNLVRRQSEAVVVDLVLDRSPDVGLDKVKRGAISLDSPEEILANKLCALLSRAEIRDLVDVLELEKAGYSLEAAAPVAIQKEGGLTHGQLAWVLDQIKIGDDARIPGGWSPRGLREALADLQRRLARLSFPS
jgi:Nucleotidyl transferase AbiEii toxin, Type IV TA system